MAGARPSPAAGQIAAAREAAMLKGAHSWEPAFWDCRGPCVPSA